MTFVAQSDIMYLNGLFRNWSAGAVGMTFAEEEACLRSPPAEAEPGGWVSIQNVRMLGAGCYVSGGRKKNLKLLLMIYISDRGRAMYIIADVEWVQNRSNKQSPTQLCAVRVDSEWNVVGRFFSYIRPMNASFHDWNHVAYTGGMPDDFLYARNCHNVFSAFNAWIGEDTLCWWLKPSSDLYALINKVVLRETNVKSVKILSDYISGFLDAHGKGSAYKLARERGIEVPTPEHDSENDVKAIVNLLKGVQFPQTALEAALPEPPICSGNTEVKYQYDVANALLHKIGCPCIPAGVETVGFATLKSAIKKGYKPCMCVKKELRLAKREKVIDEISRSQYTYMYAENGTVFHRYDCGLLHNAGHILGAIKYDTILEKGLRPCKVCRPSAAEENNPLLVRKKIVIMSTPKLAKRALKRPEMTAMTRLRQAQKERYSGVLREEMTKQEKDDLFTLTQPRYGFFASKGYQNFHVRNCIRLNGKSNIRGFDTFEHACRTGYTPCRFCKPNRKQDVIVSIPIDNKVRTDETVADLSALCNQYGYAHRCRKGLFELETAVGKWIIYTDARPVTVEHINLAKTPHCGTYHKQPRLFLSMLDALRYIRRHDEALERDGAEATANCEE